MKAVFSAAVLMAAVFLAALGGCRSPNRPAIPEDVVLAFGTWGPPGDNDACLKKFDQDGVEDTMNWDLLMDDGTMYCESNVMDLDSDGNVYLVYGFSNSGGGTSYDWRIRKFDSSGVEDALNWNKTFDGSMNNGPDSPVALLVDSNDDVYVFGYCRDGVNSNLYDWRIKKYTSSGAEIVTGWDKTVSGDDAESSDLPETAAVDSNNNLYVAGRLDTAGGFVRVIKKYSSAGVEDTVNWNKSVTASAVECLAVDGDDNLYVGGSNLGDLLIKKYSSAGDEDTLNWNQSIDINLADTVRAMAVDSGGNLYAACTFFNGTDSDWCIKKFSSAGTEDTTDWDIDFDGGGEDWLSSIAVGGQDDVYVFGLTADGASAYNWAILKYAPDGTEDTINWDKLIGASAVNADSGVTIIVDY